MSKLKNINLTNLYLFGAALLATTVTYALSPTSAKSASSPSVQLEQMATDKQDKVKNLAQVTAHNQASIPLVSAANFSTANLLLAQATDSSAVEEASEQPRNELLKLLSLTFLLLFFVPLGIFYPLFLFYRMLLTKPKKLAKGSASSSTAEVAKPQAGNNHDSSSIQDINRATVSKLQIAFSPPAKELRQELSAVTSAAEFQTEDNLVELMHQVIDVLIDQGHWTHVSHNSEALPLNEVKSRFELVSNQERHKFSTEQQGLINYNRNVSGSDGYERNYSYVVVTLIFCTSHSTPLFETIKTKEQLVKELEQLKLIEDQSLIKFELLWNPQQEDIYISNDQLLLEYDEMNRLF